MASEDFDLYGDLDDAFIEPLQSEIEKKAAVEQAKHEEVQNFREQSEKLIEELKTSNFQLKKNISLLLATAKSEIERKDQQIKDLRRELDEIIFRKNKGSKKTLEKWSQTEKVEFSDSKSNNRSNESNKLYDKHKLREPTSSSRKDVPEPYDRHKRRASPERKRYDEPRRSSRRDEANGHRSKTHDRDLSRKSSQERGKSLEKHDKNDRKGSSRESLRDDDLRKVLSKNKCDEKSNSVAKEKNRQGSVKKDKSKSEKSDNKSTKGDKNDSKKRSREKTVTPKKSKSKKGSAEVIDVDNILPNSTENIIITEAVNFESIEILRRKESTDTKSTVIDLTVIDLTNDTDKQMPCDQSSVEPPKNIDTKLDQKEEAPVPENDLLAESNSKDLPEKSISCESVDQKVTEECKITEEDISLNLTNDCQVVEHVIEESVQNSEIIEHKKEIFVPISEDKFIQKTEIIIKSIDEPQPINKTEEKSVESKQEFKDEVISIPKENILNLSTETANDSIESTKENSLNNSKECKKGKKRKIVTTEIESDGTVVWTIKRKKRKT